jgi:uncharacterized protein
MKHVLLFLVLAYRAFPLLWRPRCRFWPTCSQYAYEAIQAYGAMEGLRRAARRLLSCHPLGRHGLEAAVRPAKDRLL